MSKDRILYLKSVPTDNPPSGFVFLYTDPADGLLKQKDDAGNVKTMAVESDKMVDMWRLTSSFTGNGDPITTNLERVDTHGFGQIGAGMTEASGVFTFPNTGVYRVDFNVYSRTDTTDDRNIVTHINVSVDGGTSYNKASQALGHIKNIGGAATYIAIPAHHIIKVPDTSTHKITFSVEADAGTTTIGSTNINTTYMTFERKGNI